MVNRYYPHVIHTVHSLKRRCVSQSEALEPLEHKNRHVPANNSPLSPYRFRTLRRVPLYQRRTRQPHRITLAYAVVMNPLNSM